MAKYSIYSKSSKGMLRTYIHSIEITEFKVVEGGTEIFNFSEFLGIIPKDLVILRNDLPEVIQIEDEEEVAEMKKFLDDSRKRLSQMRKE